MFYTLDLARIGGHARTAAEALTSGDVTTAVQHLEAAMHHIRRWQFQKPTAVGTVLLIGSEDATPDIELDREGSPVTFVRPMGVVAQFARHEGSPV